MQSGRPADAKRHTAYVKRSAAKALRSGAGCLLSLCTCSNRSADPRLRQDALKDRAQVGNAHHADELRIVRFERIVRPQKRKQRARRLFKAAARLALTNFADKLCRQTLRQTKGAGAAYRRARAKNICSICRICKSGFVLPPLPFTRRVWVRDSRRRTSPR